MADKDKQKIPEGTIFVQPRAEYLVPDAGGGYKNALWERHPAHPGGEISIDGPGIVEVAQTSEVMARLAPRLEQGGTLVRLEGKALERAQAAAAASRRTEEDRQAFAADAQRAVQAAQDEATAAREAAAASAERERAQAAELARLQGEIAELRKAAK